MPAREPRQRWAMVGAGAALVGTSYGLARFAYGLFAPEIAREFAIDATVSGVIGAGSYVGYCVAIVLSLVLTPRWGPRRVATLAGAVATVGTAVVAVAPSAPVLAAGLLVAGASTGIASPPMAAAVSAWVREEAQDRAQTMVNAGTGLGVLVSGPVALVALNQWRWAWAGFACVTAVVTIWVHLAVPAGTGRTTRPDTASRTVTGLPRGTGRLVVASFLMGLASIAVWTFGRDLIVAEGDASALVSALTWTTLGVAGVLGAVGGDLVQRVGLGASWVALMLALGVATALFALNPSTTLIVLTAAALFGASYIGLTGVVLVWSTRIYPDRVSFGVGISFFAIAAGQAVGAPLIGYLTGSIGSIPAFVVWSAVALVGALVGPRSHPAAAVDVPTPA